MKIYKEGYKFEMSASSFGQSNHGCTNWSEYTRIDNAWVCTDVVNCNHACHCGTVWDEVGRVMTDDAAEVWLSSDRWEVVGMVMAEAFEETLLNGKNEGRECKGIFSEVI